MRILVTGSTRYEHADRVHQILHAAQTFYNVPGRRFTLIHGNAVGADTQADDSALKLGWNIWRFPAEWDFYADLGKRSAAGMIRNREMADTLPPDLCIAFPRRPKEEVRSGTWGMVRHCWRTGIPVVFGGYRGEPLPDFPLWPDIEIHDDAGG